MWFRGDMVEVMKGPDKGKLGIIAMVIQVGLSVYSFICLFVVQVITNNSGT